MGGSLILTSLVGPNAVEVGQRHTHELDCQGKHKEGDNGSAADTQQAPWLARKNRGLHGGEHRCQGTAPNWHSRVD
jgi:hypothetical protein